MRDVRLVFDRGTLVLEGVPREVDFSGIPGVSWDARSRVHRAAAAAYYAVASELWRRGVQVTDRPRPKMPPPTLRTGAGAAERRPDPSAALAAWRLAGRRGVLALPSEQGRVQLALAAIEDAATPALVLVTSEGLRARWSAFLRDRFRDLRELCADAGSAGPVTVTTFSEAHRRMWQLGDQFGLLVIDDVHELGLGFPDDAVAACAAPLRLGLTGPGLPAGLRRRRIAELIGPLVYEVAPGGRPAAYAAAFDRVTWPMMGAADERRVRLALGALLDRHGVGGVLVFVGEEPLARASVRPEGDQRERSLLHEAHAAGRVRELGSAHALVPGRHVPDADVAVALGSHRAERQPSRTLARLLRPPEGQRAIVYELTVTDHGRLEDRGAPGSEMPTLVDLPRARLG